MDAVLQLVPESERAALSAAANDLAEDTAPWATALLGPQSAKMNAGIAMVVSAIAPALAQPKRRLLAQYILWVYALDNRVDAPQTSPAELRTLGTRIAAIVDGAPDAENDDLLVRLDVLLGAIGRESGAQSSAARFRGAFAAGIHAGIEQAVQSRDLLDGSASAPTVDEYLKLAGQHIHVTSFAFALLALLGVEDPAQPELDEALAAGSRAVRLANDLRSSQRDRAEATLSILTLRTADGQQVTPAMVEELADRNVADHDRNLAAATAVPAAARRALQAMLRVGVGLYRAADLR